MFCNYTYIETPYALLGAHGGACFGAIRVSSAGGGYYCFRACSLAIVVHILWFYRVEGVLLRAQ